jgi:hypothetical protein
MMMKFIMIVIVMVEDNFHVKLFDYPIEKIKAYYLFLNKIQEFITYSTTSNISSLLSFIKCETLLIYS